jgi:hypothetical protein
MAIALLHDTAMLDATLTAERCEEATPGKNPRVFEDLGPPSTAIVIKNLPYSSRDDELARELAAFASLATPLSVSCRTNSAGQCTGIAFVQFTSLADAQHACQTLSGVDVSGRKIRVEYKRADTPKTACVPYVAPDEASRRCMTVSASSRRQPRSACRCPSSTQHWLHSCSRWQPVWACAGLPTRAMPVSGARMSASARYLCTCSASALTTARRVLHCLDDPAPALQPCMARLQIWRGRCRRTACRRRRRQLPAACSRARP